MKRKKICLQDLGEIKLEMLGKNKKKTFKIFFSWTIELKYFSRKF